MSTRTLITENEGRSLIELELLKIQLREKQGKEKAETKASLVRSAGWAVLLIAVLIVLVSYL